jgi:hypothetical protein
MQNAFDAGHGFDDQKNAKPVAARSGVLDVAGGRAANPGGGRHGGASMDDGRDIVTGWTARAAARGRRWAASALGVVAMVQAAAGVNEEQQGPAALTDAEVKALALRWFAAMQKGEIDRDAYAAAYVDQITDAAVRAMSHHLNSHGAAPTGAEIVETRGAGRRRFYLVEFAFPQGGATSLSFGIDAAAKIAGIGLAGLAEE